MNILMFVFNLINALAWPIAVVFLARMLRTELAGLLVRINSVKAPGVEFNLTKSLDRGRESSEQVAIELSETHVRDQLPSLSKTEMELAEQFPEGAIEMFYKEIERRLLELRAQLPDNKPHRYLNEVIKWLKDSGYITQNTVNL